jgi:hypothetical protein
VCGVCFEESSLLSLPCKIIYFDIATTERPIHWRELTYPNWPFELDDDNDNDPERIKYNEYEEFRLQWFNMDNSYEKLIKIRNNLLSIRPDWMNTDEFLNYENEELKYSSQCARLDKEWDEYVNKFKGNETCPFCKDQPTNVNHCISCFFYKLEYGTM